jgi:hypothetical protein
VWEKSFLPKMHSLLRDLPASSRPIAYRHSFMASMQQALEYLLLEFDWWIPSLICLYFLLVSMFLALCTHLSHDRLNPVVYLVTSSLFIWLLYQCMIRPHVLLGFWNQLFTDPLRSHHFVGRWVITGVQWHSVLATWFLPWPEAASVFLIGLLCFLWSASLLYMVQRHCRLDPNSQRGPL